MIYIMGKKGIVAHLARVGHVGLTGVMPETNTTWGTAHCAACLRMLTAIPGRTEYRNTCTGAQWTMFEEDLWP
jgi:hypothetical protein